MRKNWTKKERDELKKLVNKGGMSFEMIGKILGRSRQSCSDYSRRMFYQNHINIKNI
jgi:transposase